jgi:hypothetical protein
MMNKSESLEILLQHARLEEGPRFRTGIVAMMRPFDGIKESNFHEVMECLYLLQGELASDRLNKDIAYALLNITSALQEAFLFDSSALLRNRLIDKNGSAKLAAWTSIIYSASLSYMRGRGHAVALSAYLEYLLHEPLGLQCAEALLHDAIADSFDRDPDFATCAILLCVRYPAVGNGFRKQINRLAETADDPDLIDALRVYHESQQV